MNDTRSGRFLAGLGTLVFLFVAPGFVAGLVPYWITRWRFGSPGVPILRTAGALLVVAGVAVLLEAFWRFAVKGLGTPAPILPTRRLVVSGLYRFVRNPMYLAVTAMVLGQAMLFGDVRLLEYGAFVWCAFHAFVLLYEEPTLTAAYPAEYAIFRANVPRWIPRLRPWQPESLTEEKGVTA
ncbi:MAG: isoprenylcysteine carboxylmethyltransferase family protein [Acidobacteriota bacterium]|nr:isoprenylcysteine carboxylmethyltransferase family protein [Acidobacteriota bacterium]